MPVTLNANPNGSGSLGINKKKHQTSKGKLRPSAGLSLMSVGISKVTFPPDSCSYALNCQQ